MSGGRCGTFEGKGPNAEAGVPLPPLLPLPPLPLPAPAVVDVGDEGGIGAGTEADHEPEDDAEPPPIVAAAGGGNGGVPVPPDDAEDLEDGGRIVAPHVGHAV